MIKQNKSNELNLKAPDVIEGTQTGTRFLGSVVTAANNTAPLIMDVGLKWAHNHCFHLSHYSRAFKSLQTKFQLSLVLLLPMLRLMQNKLRRYQIHRL